jgi:hypothetical protein
VSKEIEYLVIHCSDSHFGDANVIRKWHKARGWRDIGYNGVILNGNRNSGGEYNLKEDGLFEMGRGLDLSVMIESDEKGAHVLGYNDKSIGICLIGKNKFTIPQFKTLIHLVSLFKRIVPDIKVRGHYQMPTANGKTCPNFDIFDFHTLLSGDTFTDSVITEIIGQGKINDTH